MSKIELDEAVNAIDDEIRISENLISFLSPISEEHLESNIEDSEIRTDIIVMKAEVTGLKIARNALFKLALKVPEEGFEKREKTFMFTIVKFIIRVRSIFGISGWVKFKSVFRKK